MKVEPPVCESWYYNALKQAVLHTHTHTHVVGGRVRHEEKGREGEREGWMFLLCGCYDKCLVMWLYVSVSAYVLNCILSSLFS